MADRTATVLERAIARGQEGSTDPNAVLWAMAASSIVILHDGEPPADEFPPRPLLISRDGHDFVAAFTHEDLSTRMSEGYIPVLVPAFELLRRVPPTHGIVLNPGWKLGLEIPREGVRGFAQLLVDTQISL